MNIDEVKKTIKQFIVKEFLQGSSETNLGDDTLLFDSGIIDSLGMIKLMVCLKESFSLDIKPSDVSMDTFNTIEKIADFVIEKKRENT
ncbi:acyl carrier protein [Acidobacteriota bacterium]